MLRSSTPRRKLDNSRVVHFDEIAFMIGKWEGVKNKPLASAISMTNLDGRTIKAPIIIGGDDILEKSQPSTLCELDIPKKPKKTGIKSVDESLDTFSKDPLPNTDLFVPPADASKAASDNGMELIGVNKSSYFKSSSFLHALSLVSKQLNSSPANPVVMVGDGAKIHTSAEV